MVTVVVGGNGQLGHACCAELRARGRPVRATVRDPSRAGDLAALDVEVATFDVTDGNRREAVLEGAEAIIVTANAVAPRRGDDPAAFDRALEAFVADVLSAGVRRVVLPSVPVSALDEQVPVVAARRRLEARVAASPAQGWVLRMPPFMEVWLALVGSSLPARGEPHATVGRQSPFVRRFRGLTGSLVERRGVMLVPGHADNRHAFLAVRDAARACAEAAGRDDAPADPVEVAGPEILSWRQVADVYARVLGRPVRVLGAGEGLYAAAARALRPVAAVPSRTMALNRYLAAVETAWPQAGGGLVDPATMTTVETLLREKAALGSSLPVVP